MKASSAPTMAHSAHAAERVLNGERPQVDFYDNYTGALSYVDAFGLKLFGMRMQSLRWMLFLFFAAWVPAIWYLASRFASPLGASLITLLAVLWSTPIYPAPGGILVQLVLRHLRDGGVVSLYRGSPCLSGYFWRAFRRVFRSSSRSLACIFSPRWFCFWCLTSRAPSGRRRR
jgi:hypothetical protein